MTEPEVSLYIALDFIKSGQTNRTVHVSIDGAHVKIGKTILFDICKFLLDNGFVKCDLDTDKWQGEYSLDGYDTHIVISSTPGVGDVRIETVENQLIIVESKKGRDNRNGQEYALMREAIGQLMTNEYDGKDIRLIVAVPYSDKSVELAKRWIEYPQIINAGIGFFLVENDGSVVKIFNNNTGA